MAQFNIVIVAQAGRLAVEAVLFAASLRHAAPGFRGRLFVAEPQPGPLWTTDPRIANDKIEAALHRLGAEIIPFQATLFGDVYPNANKAEALAALPEGPFVFFDSDTLITGPINEIGFDFTRPSASMARTGSWPRPALYGPDHAAIWGALFDAFDLDMEPTLDLSQPEDHWERHLYFNAGWFFHEDPARFGARYLEVMRRIHDEPPDALIGQDLFPWLDQIALPLVIHGLGGGRPGPDLAPLDGTHSRHYRSLAQLFARADDAVIATLNEITAPNWIKMALKSHPAFHRMLYRGDGTKVRSLVAQDRRPRSDDRLRKMLKRHGLWMR